MSICMRYIHIILIYSLLGTGYFILSNCGGGGGGGSTPAPAPIDNNSPHIIEFTQPAVFADGSPMSVPSSVGGYYLYVCHVIDGTMVDNMIWVAEINTNVNPLIYEQEAWRGRWDIFNLVGAGGILVGTVPDGTHAFALKSVSSILGPDGRPLYVSPFSVPWIYNIKSIPLDNTQIPQEGDPLAQHSNVPVNMLFNTGGSSN